MKEVTQILSAIEQGDPQAAEKLLPLVYEELRKLAAHKLSQEERGQTLDATALVHEAYLRLVGGETQRPFNDRGHFYAAAATAMRHILIDNGRSARHISEHSRPPLDLRPGLVAGRAAIPITPAWENSGTLLMPIHFESRLHG